MNDRHVPTVLEGLKAYTEEMGVAPEDLPQVEEAYLASRTAGILSERYRRLTQEVLCRLPWEWDVHCTWVIEESEKRSPQGYGSAHREEEGEGDCEQFWVVTLYPAMLDRLSDAACRWVIAHELAHVASGLPTGSIVIRGKPHTRIKGTVDEYQETASKVVHEDTADEIALEWGFSEEMQALLAEDC